MEITQQSTVTKQQRRKFGPKHLAYHGTLATIVAEVRYDDECGNGHNTFAITGVIRATDRHINPRDGGELAGGCLHEEIAAAFPDLAPLIKWHLVSSDWPMHYVANTLYYAGDRDCHGLRKDEKRQIRSGKTGKLAWITALVDEQGNEVSLFDWTASFGKLHTLDSDEQPPDPKMRLVYVPWCTVGEGKERELDHARTSAVWPEATDEELCADRDVLKAKLEARLPALLVEFRSAVESLGFTW